MTKPFDPNDWAAVQAALDNPDPNDPVARAIADRFESMMAALRAVAEKGPLPDRIEVSKPTTIVNAAAIELFRSALAAMPGSPQVVIMDTGRQ